MEIGENLLKLRKNSGMSQEQLATKIGVTRQTISNWELNESSPDLKQAKELSKIFNISLDELVGNEVKDILVQKVSNTERLAGLIIKIMQVVGIISFLVLVALVSILFFANYFEATPGSQGVMTECTLNGQTNYYTVVYDEYRNIEAVKSDGNYLTDININIEEFESPESLLLYIEEYIISQGGTCK